MPGLLSEDQILRQLGKLDGWTLKGDYITKSFEFKTFLDGIAFVDAVAKVAEEQEHHPDIGVAWTTVTLSLQTHSEGGVTRYDVDLAKAIDAMGKIPGLKRR